MTSHPVHASIIVEGLCYDSFLTFPLTLLRLAVFSHLSLFLTLSFSTEEAFHPFRSLPQTLMLPQLAFLALRSRLLSLTFLLKKTNPVEISPVLTFLLYHQSTSLLLSLSNLNFFRSQTPPSLPLRDSDLAIFVSQITNRTFLLKNHPICSSFFGSSVGCGEILYPGVSCFRGPWIFLFFLGLL